MNTTYTGQDIAAALEAIAPLNSGVPHDQLGFLHGDPLAPVTGLACCWCAHPQSIQRALALDCNMIICHEAILMPPQESSWYDVPETIALNETVQSLMDEHGLLIYRSHSNWDALKEDGVTDQAIAALNIPGLKVHAAQKFIKVLTLPEPMTIKALCDKASEGFRFQQPRIFGNPDQIIERFGILIGGFGENQWHMPQALRDMGAEAMIIGEMSEFVVLGALEMGMPVIETLHSASEIPAIRRQARMLGDRLPGLPVHYVASGAAAWLE